MKDGVGCGVLCLAMAFGVSAVSAGELEARAKELEKLIEDQGIYLETAKTGVKLGGWVNASYTYGLNGGGTDSGANGTPTENLVTGDDSNDFNVNAVRLILEKALPEENTWAAGFRVDLVFGEDAKGGFDNDPGFGNGDSAVNIEAAYVQVRVPVGPGIDVSVGKWFALLGYEATDRAENDNFTFGLLASFLEPGTHTGILASIPLNDLLTFHFGVANGWDNSDTDFLDGDEFLGDDGPSDIAKMITTAIELTNPGGNAWLIAAAAWSPEGEAFAANVANGILDGTADGSDIDGTENQNFFAFSINGAWEPVCCDGRLKLAFNVDFVYAEDNLHRFAGDPAYARDANGATAWGVALYAKYNLSDRFYLAGRAEYLRADDGTLGFTDGLVPWDNSNASIDENNVYTSNADLYSFTLTAGFTPCEGLLLRAEYRLDAISSDGGDDGENNLFGNNQTDQHMFSVDAVYTFW